MADAKASMRPQHITAENLARRGLSESMHSASMRPQHITAENLVVPPALDAEARLQ